MKIVTMGVLGTLLLLPSCAGTGGWTSPEIRAAEDAKRRIQHELGLLQQELGFEPLFAEIAESSFEYLIKNGGTLEFDGRIITAEEAPEELAKYRKAQKERRQQLAWLQNADGELLKRLNEALATFKESKKGEERESARTALQQLLDASEHTLTEEDRMPARLPAHGEDGR